MNYLVIHFLNVGHGDCTVVEFPSGNRTVIDINNSRALDEETETELAEKYGYSPELYGLYKALGTKPKEIDEYEANLTDPVDFYLSRYGRDPIFRFILTHPDMDHMTGLYRLSSVERIPVLNFWDTKHSVSKSDDPQDWNSGPYDLRDWKEYQRLRVSTSSPKACYFRSCHELDFFKGDGITIWRPVEHDEDTTDDEDVNNLSYVLLITFGHCRILLGGDCPSSAWQEMYDSVNGELPKIHLLKAPHHGRKTGYHWQSLRAMDPDYTIVSVGKLKKKEDATTGYEKWSAKGCFTTRDEGSITANCWEDGDVWLYDESGNRLNP